MSTTRADSARNERAATRMEGRYEKLLATVGNLQSDLQRTVGVCQSLGAQNDKLKSNYEAVGTELIQLREKHNTTRKQLLEAVENRVAADQRTETLVNKWKVQLEARTRELESLQAKLVPQDLDMLRAKVQEELDVPHQRRVAHLEAEVEQHRQMFCKARREHERCKAEYEQYTIDQGREMEAVHQQHEAETHALKTRIRGLEDSCDDAMRGEEGRLLRRRLEEAEAARSQLHAEVAAVRSEKEALELDRHKLMLRHHNEAAASRVQVSNAEAEKQALQRRCADSEEALGRRQRQADEARDRLQDALEEISKLREACAGKDRVAQEARAEAKHASDRLASEWGREKAELRQANEALAKRLTLAERRARETAEQAASRVRGAQQVEDRARREAEQEVAALREVCARLERETERLRLEGEQASGAAKAELHRLRGEAERAKSEASRALREKDALRERVAALQSLAERATEASSEAARERDEAKLATVLATQRAQQQREKLADAQGESDGLRTRLQIAEEDLAALVADADRAREAHGRALKGVRRAAQRECDSCIEQVRRELEALRRRARRTVRKERKRSRAYKEKAIEAHERGMRARRVLQARAAAAAVAAGMPLMGRGDPGRTSATKLDSTVPTVFGTGLFDGASTWANATKTARGLDLGDHVESLHLSHRNRRGEKGDRTNNGHFARDTHTTERTQTSRAAQREAGGPGSATMTDTEFRNEGDAGQGSATMGRQSPSVSDTAKAPDE